jgi:hypothetical protein
MGKVCSVHQANVVCDIPRSIDYPEFIPMPFLIFIGRTLSRGRLWKVPCDCIYLNQAFFSCKQSALEKLPKQLEAI